MSSVIRRLNLANTIFIISRIILHALTSIIPIPFNLTCSVIHVVLKGLYASELSPFYCALFQIKMIVSMKLVFII